jgi:2-polyprenyl-3-methyl-5-hydroxy-6-metoxy-1,4-benzoquinol methylase
MDTINEIRLANDVAYVNGNRQTVVIGKHSFWFPELEIKIVNSFNGKIEPYRDWEKGLNTEQIRDGTFNADISGFDQESKDSLVTEWHVMRELAGMGSAPPIGDVVFVKNFVSDFPYGHDFCDSQGRYGYHMKNAEKLPKGNFVPEHIRSIKKLAVPSERTYGDFGKPGNIVNGYLVDIRRTMWDMVTLGYSEAWHKKQWKKFEYKQDKDDLIDKIMLKTQFPANEREENYQTYYIDGKYEAGSRDTLRRFYDMTIPDDLSGQTVIDLGCQLGMIASECWRRGARIISGYDNVPEYVDCARDLARYNGMNISFMSMDLKQFAPKREKPVDIVFALSLYKHLGDRMFEVLKSFPWKTCHIESNGSPEGFESEHAKQIETGIIKLGRRFVRNGFAEDRSKRCLWKVE